MDTERRTDQKVPRFQNIQPLPYTIDKTLTPALMYVFDQPLTVIEHVQREIR